MIKKLVGVVILALLVVGGYKAVEMNGPITERIQSIREPKILGKYTEMQYAEQIGKLKEKYKYPEDGNIDTELEKVVKLFPEANYLIEHREEIPDQVIEVFLKYPENFLYARNYLEREQLGKDKSLTKEEKEADVPLLFQTDPRWGYEKLGPSLFARGGCGQTSLSMVLIAKTKDTSLTPLKLRDIAEEGGYYKKKEGTSWTFMSDVPKKYDLNSRIIKISEKGMKKELDNGALLIVSVKKGDFSYGGHFMVIVGYNDEGFLIHDPNSFYNSQKAWSFKRLQPQLRNAWSIK
ncbi:C39 family peptidase [Guggenheimella bovis]